jgi:hypothetical protein
MLGDETDSNSNHTSLPQPSKVVLFAINLPIDTAATLFAGMASTLLNDVCSIMEDAMSYRILVTFGAFAVMCISSNAMAYSEIQYGYQVYPDSDFRYRVSLVLATILVLTIGIIVCFCISLFSNGSRDHATYDANRFQSEADLMREITEHQDAQTAMMRGEIDHARTYGEYRERPEIAEHEQRLRKMRSRLR